MAARKPLFMATDGFSEEMATTDSLTLGGLTMGGDVVMDSNKITGLAAATASGDALAFGQTGGELGDLTITSGGDITVSGGGEVVGLPASPSGDTAAASKAYVDATAQGLDVHDSVVVATTEAGLLAEAFENGDDIDGVTLATGDRILIKDQASGIENGIYVVQATGAPVRADDWASGYAAAGAFVFVEEGGTNADAGWVCTSNTGSDVTATDALAFSQFSGAGQISAGAGLTKDGNTIDVGAGLGIVVNVDDVQVKIDIASTTTTEANAVALGANGLSVKVDDSTLEGSGQGSAGAESLRIKDGGITGSHLASNIAISTTGNIETTAGIFTGDGSGLTNLPAAASTDAVTISALKSTAGTLTVGQAVHLVGYSSPDYTVELADADGAGLMPAIGIVATTVTDSVAGTIVIQGRVLNVNTASWSAGDSLYVSTTAGTLTNVKPTGVSSKIQRIGEVALSDAAGVILVTGAGRSNDIPNIAEDNLWIGNSSGVGTSTPVGDGLASTAGTSLAVDITPDIGLHFNSGVLEIELDNSPDTLDADASGLKVVGLPSLFKINDVAVGASVTAANLDDLVDGSNADSLHSHAAAPATEAPKVENAYTATATVAAGDPVFFDGTANQFGKADAGDNAKSYVFGVAGAAINAAASGDVISYGPAAGVLTGATPGTKYYLADGGGLSTSVPGSGKRVILLGWAINATDLWVQPIDYGKKAA